MRGHEKHEEEALGRPRVGVSSCLLGAPVRYNGGHCRFRFLTEELSPYVDWLPVCPEAEIGLGVPRPTLRLQRRAGSDRVVGARDGSDHTEELAAVADKHLDGLRRLDGYVLKHKSPSCGMFALPVFDEEGHRVGGRGRGAFTSRLAELVPGLPMEEQGRLSDPSLREAFVERLFAHARLRELWESDWRPRDLVGFHSRHKIQLMAHTPEGYRETGRIAARAGARDRDRTVREYTDAFRRALAVPAGRGRHANALQHVFGMIGPLLDGSRRKDLLAAVEDYWRGQVPLSLPVALLRHHCDAEEVAWACRQTYLRPYPDSLGLRHPVAV